MKDKTDKQHEGTIETINTGGKAHSMALTLDLDKYLGQLEHWDYPDEQKAEFISALWTLLVGFAEIGFEIHPAQQALKSAQKPPETGDKSHEKSDVSSANVLYSSHNLHTENNSKVDELGLSEKEEILS
ncbi:MAG: hypothetical protein AAGC95_11320 [Pseudomonadota bacterium]